MKTIKKLVTISFLTVLAGTQVVHAYSYEENQRCRKPKFREMEPPKLTEVVAGSEISFHVSGWADPEHITATVKKIPMKVNVVDKMSFFVVTAKLPGELKGPYARISIAARAKEGYCKGKDGWLIKIKEKQSSDQEPENSGESAADN